MTLITKLIGQLGYDNQVRQALNDAAVELPLAASGFTFKGEHDPSVSEYPATPTIGDLWIISTATPYTFTTGDLLGQQVATGNQIAYGGTSWGIVNYAEFTQAELDAALALKRDILDSYSQTEIDAFLALYYTKTLLDGGQLDNRYYTETEIDAFLALYYTKTLLDGGQLDTRYYTEAEIDALVYTKTQIDTAVADRRKQYAKETLSRDVVVGDVTAGKGTIILTAAENLYGRVVISDTGVLTSVASELLISSDVRDFEVINNDNVDWKVWRDNGAGVGVGGFILVLAGKWAKLYCDGSDVTDNGTPFGINQKRVDVSGIRAIGVPEQNLTERAISILVSTSTTAAANLSLIVNSGQITRISMSANVVYTIEHKILPNDTYQINIDAGTTTVYFWTEIGR